ncbi:MAG: hypothetical protein KKB59_10485 [Spirochaetes bacterium]|nr:hypothetical protein [Spirochaetota bacterium]
MIGRVTSDPWVSRVKNGEGHALMLQVQFSGGADVRTVQYMPQAGEDTVPVRGTRVAVVDVGGLLVAVASQDGIKSTGKMGEKELYSHNSAGQKLASLRLKDNGHAWLGNRPSGKNLRTVLQNLITGIQGATYIPYPGGVAGPPVPIVDTTGKIATALTDLASVLDDTP